MQLYLSHQSAVEMIRHLRTNDPETLAGAHVSSATTPRASINDLEGLASLGPTAQRWLSHLRSPIHVLVPDRRQVQHSKRIHAHVCSSPLPRGSFLNLGHDVFLSRPELTFLQMAARERLSLPKLLMYGMELCGFYGPAEDGATNYDCTPVTSASSIRSFATRATRVEGAASARRASRWLAEGSASPMESIVCLLLSLPCAVGGYGLGTPTLNPPITIRSASGYKKRYPDLYWENKQGGRAVDVEYQSDFAHIGVLPLYRDSKRQTELTVGNVTVLPLTKLQVTNADEFDEFARGLARLLGKRLRLNSGWSSRRYDLRAELFASFGKGNSREFEGQMAIF